MEASLVNDYFSHPKVVDYHADAVAEVGLWNAERKIFSRVFRPSDSILELGCGAGRISFGLAELGYQNILGTDYSKEMVASARRIGAKTGRQLPFRVCDATELEFEDGLFDGAIFGFNGLMQIPGQPNRAKACFEICRVLRSGAFFVFTTHDRDRSRHKDYWKAAELEWEKGVRKPKQEALGDRIEQIEEGYHYIYVPTFDEIESLLLESGFRVEATVMRSELGIENSATEAFSDDCRFWVAQKI